MADKSSSDNVPTDEKVVDAAQHRPSTAGTGEDGRVALNVIENPLKVRIPAIARPSHGSSVAISPMAQNYSC